MPLTTLFFWRFNLSIRTSYKQLIQCINCPNIHIHTFCERFSFILGRVFPVGILNEKLILSAIRKTVTNLLNYRGHQAYLERSRASVMELLSESSVDTPRHFNVGFNCTCQTYNMELFFAKSFITVVSRRSIIRLWAIMSKFISF